MAKILKGHHAVFCIVGLALVLSSIIEAENHEVLEEATITGVVNITGQLVTESGDSFFIVDDRIGKALARLVGRMVEVRGVVRGSEDTKTITVVGYREIE